ncbi:MAG: dephospho-CoA kinase [Rhodospirillales bacterium]|nr:dephospho-CoA kinase [Rhodospirillales bacterium]
MRILGLTGSIGMGKSAAAKMFVRLGVPVHDADAEVHRLLGKGGRAVKAVEAAFPGVVAEGAVDRLALGAKVFGDPPALKKLERILHPLVRQSTDAFLARARANHERLVVLDIPLLFEARAEGRCHATLVVSAPAFLQTQRVLARPGMSADKLAQVRARQIPDARKRRQADFLIPSGLGFRYSLVRIFRLVRSIKGAPACAKSCSIPKPRASIRRRVIASWKSGWSSF